MKMAVPETDNIVSTLFKRAVRESLSGKDTKGSKYRDNSVEKMVKSGLNALFTAIEQGKRY